MKDIIKTFSKRSEAIYEEKKSEFIGIAAPVSSESEALDFIKSVRSEYKKARHYVYAYTVFDENNLICRYSDDGEPQGTGGVPVLSVMEKGDIQNAAIVVVRYFGGVLLGASGLTRAYRKAASDAAAAAGTVYRVLYDDIFITVDYQQYNSVKRTLSIGLSGTPLAAMTTETDEAGAHDTDTYAGSGDRQHTDNELKYKIAGEDFSDKIVIHVLSATSCTRRICEAVEEAALGRVEIHIDEKRGRFDI